MTFKQFHLLIDLLRRITGKKRYAQLSGWVLNSDNLDADKLKVDKLFKDSLNRFSDEL